MTRREATRPGRAVRVNGLTLLEMLIVLAVIAVAAGATLLSLAPRRGDPAEVEARRLVATVQAAADRSILGGGDVVLAIDEHGYAVTGEARHTLPAGMAMHATARLLPLTLGRARPFDLMVTDNGLTWRVVFDGVRTTARAAT